MIKSTCFTITNSTFSEPQLNMFACVYGDSPWNVTIMSKPTILGASTEGKVHDMSPTALSNLTLIFMEIRGLIPLKYVQILGVLGGSVKSSQTFNNAVIFCHKHKIKSYSSASFCSKCMGI